MIDGLQKAISILEKKRDRCGPGAGHADQPWIINNLIAQLRAEIDRELEKMAEWQAQPVKVPYFKGDKGRWTGVSTDGFWEIELLEGHRKGETVWQDPTAGIYQTKSDKEQS